jgi:C4-dicarboxylate-binding protein DctP
MRKSGKTQLITLTEAQKGALKKALTPVYEDAAGRVGKALIEEFEKTVQGTATN